MTFHAKTGRTKLHTMAIFTVLAVKFLKIIGMWLKFLFHAVKNLRAAWKIPCREKGQWHLKYFTPWNKVVMSEKISRCVTKWTSYINMILYLNIMPSLCHAAYKGFTAGIIECLSDETINQRIVNFGLGQFPLFLLFCFLLWFRESKSKGNNR